MGILGRQIVKEMLKALVPFWLALGLILFVLEWLAQVFNVKASASTSLVLYLYKVPSHLQLVFPVAALFASLSVLGGMNRSREIMAAQSLGYSRWRIIFPTFLAVALVSVAHFYVSSYLAPEGMRKHYELYDTAVLKRPPRYSRVRQQKIWYRNQEILYNVRYFEPKNNELYDVTIYTFDDDFHIAQTIYATKASWSGHNWILHDGNISLTDKRLETPVSERFKNRFTKLIDDPKNLVRVEIGADVATQPELSGLIERYKSLGINTTTLEVTYYSRMSFILVSFIFLMLAFPRALRFRRSHTGAARDGVFVTIVCMGYWLFFNLGVNMGNTGKLSPIVATWGPSFLLLIFVFLYNRTRSLKTETE